MMEKLFRPSGGISNELMKISRFTVIGIFCSIIHVGTAILFKEIYNFTSIISSNIGFLLSFTFSFFGHYKYSFSANGPYRTYFLKFCIMSLISFGLSMLVVWSGTKLFAFKDIAVFMSLAIIIPAFNFFVSRFWVFKPHKPAVSQGQ
jgi:putative flippase GtrA